MYKRQDEQFCTIRDRGGVVGVTFVRRFLDDSWQARIEDVMRHIEHFLAWGGENTVAIGGDFDGTDLPDGMTGVESVEALAECLLRHNYPRCVSETVSKMGLHVVMLTGDNRVTAEAIRRELGIEKAISDVLPTEKEANIRALQEQGHKVAMVGDGINDAPALTRADIGIAIGAGTDIAIESADVVLMKDSLEDVATAIDLSRAVVRNIHMNLFWAFFYNILGIPVAAGVLFPAFGLRLSPMIGSAAMSLSSVCVVTNALRLRFFKQKGKEQHSAEHLAALPEDVYKRQSV